VDGEPANPVPLSLAALLESLAAQIDRLHTGTSGLLLRAVPVKSAGTGRVYGGFVYAQLRDPRTHDTIDARLPEGLAAELEWNREAVFVGLLRFKPGRGGVLKPEFRVDSVEQVGTLRVQAKSELLERWKDAAARPKRDVRAALQVDRPRLVVVTGVGSVAVDDVRSQLREAEGEIEMEIVRVSMSRPAEVTAALLRAADAHAVVITRGGGEGVHVLDDDDLIRAVAASPVPVAVALGHASDDLVVGRVADAAFPTPTAFGVWLRAVVEEKRARHVQAEEGKVLLQSQSLVEQLRGLQVSAARWRLVALVAVAGLVAAVVWFLLRSP
jgi:exodeoxyribonuclease VII large subunit